MELKRILIVEDDADIAAIERDYLELPCISRLT